MEENNNLGEFSNFMLYSSGESKVSVQVFIDKMHNTIWATQKSMAQLFDVGVPAISKHLKNIYEEGELTKDTTISKMETVVNRGFRGDVKEKVDFYNLDAIISVGYRISSYKATQFRIWATKVLKEYMVKGFALDDERLKQGQGIFGKDFFKELLERIREIRASERMFYEKITDIFRDCSEDYDPKSPISRKFYSEMQNKFHYAIHQHTASEIIKERADSTKPHMGLTNWKHQKTGGKVYKSDAVIAKNYLQEGEITALNKLVNMFLDYAERMAEKRTGSYKMEDWAKRLDMFLNFNEYPILTNAGKVSSEVAKRFAETEYSKFRVIQDREYKSDFNKLIDASINGLPKEDIDKDEKKDNNDENNDKNEDKKNPPE